jgi:lantibiotic modifying enzyme
MIFIGYVLGALWLSKETNTELPQSDIYTLCDIMVESGRKYAERQRCPCPLMYSYYKVEYLGAAHGLCTILQALLSVPGYLATNPAHARDIKTSVDYLLSLQDHQGNFPCASDEIGEQSELVHWCHGAAGMIYLMAKAYLVWHERKYLNSCEKMGELIWARGLLKKGPGICHGVAGNGYAFLLLYRLTENPKYLYRAVSFAKFLQTPQFANDARTPDYPFSLYEGIAGTACFLGDLMCPQQAVFPFSDVF